MKLTEAEIEKAIDNINSVIMDCAVTVENLHEVKQMLEKLLEEEEENEQH